MGIGGLEEAFPGPVACRLQEKLPSQCGPGWVEQVRGPRDFLLPMDRK